MPLLIRSGWFSCLCTTAAVALPGAVAVLLFRHLKRHWDEKAPPVDSVPAEEWSVEQVLAWLTSLGISAQGVRSFKENDVDGSVLLLLQEADLHTLAKRVGDVVRLREGLRDLRASRSLPSSMDGANHHTSLQNSGEAPPATDGGEGGQFANMLQEAEAVRVLLESQDFQNARPEWQKEVLQACARRFSALCEEGGKLPAELQSKILPIISRLQALLTSPSNPKTDAAPLVPSRALEKQLKSLHDMVDDFLRLLDGTTVDMDSAPMMEELKKQVGTQIGRVAAVARRLPAEYGQPLLEKCEAVVRRLERKGVPAPDDSKEDMSKVVGVTQRGPKPKNFDAALNQLRDLFNELRSSVLEEPNGQRRLQRLTTMKATLRGIQREAAAWSDCEATEVINNVAGRVSSVLEQMEGLTREELTAHSEGGAGSAAGAGEANSIGDCLGDTVDDIPVTHVVASLQAIVQVLHSQELLAAPPDVQHQMVSKLGRMLAELRQRMERAPQDETNSQILAMIDTAVGVITAATEATDSVDGATNGIDSDHRASQLTGGGRENKEPNHGSDGATHTSGVMSSGHGNEGGDDVTDEAVILLEKIFEYIDSGAFDALSPSDQREAAQRNLNQLELIEQKCRAHGGQQQVMGLILHIKGILQQKAQPGSSVEARSPLFLSSSSCIDEIQSLLGSSAFRAADAGRRKSIALCLASQVENIMSSIPHLEPHEAEIIKGLLTPISETLQDAVAEPHSTADASVSTRVNPLELISKIEELKTVMESEEFLNASPKQKHLIVSRLVVSVEGVYEQCLSLGELAAPLLPIVRAMHTQLHNLARCVEGRTGEGGAVEGVGSPLDCPAAGAKNGLEGDSGEASDNNITGAERAGLNAMLAERLGVFESVADITARLRLGNNESLVATVAELEPLQGLLTMIDTIGIFSDGERSLRDEFETQLRLAMTRAVDTASTSDDVEEVRALPDTLLRKAPPALASATGRAQAAEVPEGRTTSPNQDCAPSGRTPGSDAARLLAHLQDMLDEATCQISENPPRSEEELEPYLILLKKANEESSRLPMALLSGFKGLEESVRGAAHSILLAKEPHNGHKSGTEAHDTNAVDSEEEALRDAILPTVLEISNLLREGPVPRETLDDFSALLDRLGDTKLSESLRDAIGLVRQQLELQRVAAENNEVESTAESQSGVEDDDVVAEEDTVQGDEVTTGGREGQVAADSRIVGPLKADNKSETFVHREVSTVSPSSHKAEGEPATTPSGQRPKRIRPRRQNKGKLTAYLEKIQKNVVPGGKKSELALIGRLEDRLLKEEQHFIENTTLADIQNISKLILHLQANNDVKKNGELKGRVKRLKEKFARQVIAFKGSDRQATAVRSKLRLQCYDRVVSGQPVRNLVICTENEADKPSQDLKSEELFRLLTEGKATRAEVSSDVVRDWTGRSMAVVFREYSLTDGTVLCELLMLQEILSGRYGFDVYVANVRDMVRTMDLLQEVAAANVKRLFLYFVTDAPKSSAAHAVEFSDGSSLGYGEVIQTVQGIDRVVLAHCQPLRLNVVSMLAGRDTEMKSNPIMSVVITKEAAAEVRPVRCWLYDGLLTPAVTELLSLDEERVLCPEDLVMYIVTALSSHAIDFGSFMERESLGMGFFAPNTCLEGKQERGREGMGEPEVARSGS